MLSKLQRPDHRADVTLAPLSDVMVAGTPNRETQLHIVYIFNVLCGLKVISSRRLQ